MLIIEPHHKVLLYSLLTGKHKPEDIIDASNAAKKLSKGSEYKDNFLQFSKDEIELTIAETSLLKRYFDERKEWDLNMGEAFKELKEMFNQ